MIARVFRALASGATGVSDIPIRMPSANVEGIIDMSIGATPTITVNLEGSPDGTNWFASATGTFTTAGLQKLVKPAGEIYEYYRLNITANTNVTVNNGWIIGSEEITATSF